MRVVADSHSIYWYLAEQRLHLVAGLFTSAAVAHGHRSGPLCYRNWAPQLPVAVLDLVKAIFVSLVGECSLQRQQSPPATSAPQ